MGETMNRITKIALLCSLALACTLACRALSPQGSAPELPVSTPIPTNPSVLESPIPASPTGTPIVSTLPVPPTAPNPAASAPTSTSLEKGGPPADTTYAVILVAADDILNVRSQPGPQAQIIGQLAPDFIGITLTGDESTVGDQRWVEIRLSDGATGWVNSRYLTEYKSPADFCADPQAGALIESLKAALSRRDGDQLAELVSPAHGLNLNYFRTGNRVQFSPQEAASLFDSQVPVNWGTQPASGMDISGTFQDEVLPKLDEVLSSPYDTACNDPALGPNNYIFQWPADNKNINFISLAKPGSPGIELDWRNWLVGVEYVNGEPYVFALMQLFWEP